MPWYCIKTQLGYGVYRSVRDQRISFTLFLNTAWLENFALTYNYLIKTAKYDFAEKQFTFNSISVFKKVQLNLWQNCHDLFWISGVPVWFRCNHIFGCYILSGHRAITFSYQTAPTLYYGQPSSTLYVRATLTHLEENSSMVRLPYKFKKQMGIPVQRSSIRVQQRSSGC
jgi:hypothetical protein